MRGKQPEWAKPYLIHRTKAGTNIAFLAYTFPYYITYAPNRLVGVLSLCGGWREDLGLVLR